MRKTRIKCISAAFAILLLLSLCGSTGGDEGLTALDDTNVCSDAPVYRWIDTGRFIRLDDMEEALAASEEYRLNEPDGLTEADGRIRCLTLPHHLPAAGLSIRALRRMEARDGQPDIVILLGPNHANAGPAAAVTSARWLTPYGIVTPEEEIIETLAGLGLAEEGAEVFEQEHSIGAVIPWLSRFLPEAKIVPLIFHHQYPVEKLESILEALEPWLDQGALLLLSVDFSHHQTRDGAEKNDRETAALLDKGDWRRLSRLSGDYIDCPTVMAAIMRFASARDWLGPAVIDHTNAGFLTGAADQEVTSYFVLAYTD